MQLYLSFPGASGTRDAPVKVLRGFEKVTLGRGGKTTVEFKLKRRDVSEWDVGAQQWRIPRGAFKAGVGFSSRDIPLESEFNVLA